MMAAVVASGAFADTQTVNGVEWRYTVEGRHATLNSGVRDEWGDAENGVCIDSSVSGEIVIPSKLGGRVVTAIGDGAFRNCDKITSICVPASVENIGDAAFFGCTSLTNINLSEGLEEFDDDAFLGCPRVKSIILPNSVKGLGETRWNSRSIHATAQLQFKPDNGRYTIKGSAIYDKDMTTLVKYCGNDRRVVIEPGISSVAVGAFHGSAIEEVVLPESLEVIEEDAFNNCDNIVYVEIPVNVKKIASDAFEYCDNLCAVFYHGRKVDMADDSFRYCGRIVSFVRNGCGWENEDGVLAGCRKRKGDAYTNDYWNPQEMSTLDAKLELVRRHLVEWATKKDAKACAVLAKFYKEGKLKQSGDECEMKYLRLGCDASGKHGEYRHKEGWFMCQIGECYRTGRGVAVDYAEALKWYDNAQDKGVWKENGTGDLWLGLSEMFEKGLGVEKSPSAAFCIARLGLQLRCVFGEGCSDVYERCGDLYRGGIGVKADKTQSDKMYWKALQCQNLDAETEARIRTKLGVD